MELWIILALAAAAFQTVRFALQKSLNVGGLSAGGATFARFVYAVPFVLLTAVIALAATGADWPGFAPSFWPYALIGGLAQILATWCVVALFQHRNFTVGITFKKTEVLMTALVGFAVLGDRIGSAALMAIALGMVGVLVLSDPPGGTGNWRRRIVNPAAGLGLLSGLFFAVSAVGYRGATLAVGSDLAVIRAVLSLGFVCLVQTLGLGLWLRLREPGQLTRVARAWRPACVMGATSMAGSLCWFTAFTLQNAALVFAIGQVEVIFSLVVSVLFFGERTARREAAGIALITLSVLLLTLLQ